MKPSGAVFLLALALFLWNLGGHDLWAPDEPYFAEGAREMVMEGRWAVPHVNGVVTTDKPPLFFWLIALVSLLTGEVTPLSARLPSALAGLGTVVLTMRLGGRLGGEKVAAFAGLLAATNYLVWDKARSSQIDSLLCFLVLVAVSAFEAYRAGDADGRRAGLLFWLGAALAVLAKGPVGLLLPVGIAAVTLAWDGSLRAWRGFAPWSGPALFIAMTGGWIAWASQSGAVQYSVWEALKEHALERALHGMHHPQPPWYYLTVLPVQLLPWSGLVPAALVVAWRVRAIPGSRLLLTWALFVVIFFSASTEKRDLYVLPAYPAFFLLAAILIEALDRGDSYIGRRWGTWPQAACGAAVALAGVALPFLGDRVPPAPSWVLWLLGAFLVLTGGSGAVAVIRGRVRSSVLLTAAGASAAYLVAVTWLLPALDPVKSARSFSQVVAERTSASRSAGREVVAFRLGNLPEAISFYTNGVYLREISDVAELSSHLEQPARVFAVANAEELSGLPDDLQSRIVTIASTRLSRMQVILVANGPDAEEPAP